MRSLKSKLLKLWYGFAPGTIEFAGIKGYLPTNLQKSEPYIIGLKPYVFGESFERIRWN